MVSHVRSVAGHDGTGLRVGKSRGGALKSSVASAKKNPEDKPPAHPAKPSRLSKLAEEVGKRDPFYSLSQEAYLNLVRTASELTAPLDALFRKHGLTRSTYNVLRILRGHHPAGLPSQDIGPKLLDRAADVTRLIDRLVREELVRRDRDERDRRVIRVRITRKGLGLLKRLDKPLNNLHDHNFPKLSDAELTKLIQLLEKARLGCCEKDC